MCERVSIAAYEHSGFLSLFCCNVLPSHIQIAKSDFRCKNCLGLTILRWVQNEWDSTSPTVQPPLLLRREGPLVLLHAQFKSILGQAKRRARRGSPRPTRYDPDLAFIARITRRRRSWRTLKPELGDLPQGIFAMAKGMHTLHTNEADFVKCDDPKECSQVHSTCLMLIIR